MQAEPSAREQLLDEVVTNYLRAAGAGRRPDRQELLNRYPDLAAELNEFFADQDQVQELAAPLRSIAPAPGASGQTFGDFEAVEEIGRGGMGVVYRARQRSLNRTVALKVLPFAATLDPRQLRRFHNEAQAAAGLHHTNIVPVYYVGCEGGVHFYAMQFIDGRDLASVIAQLRERARGPKPDPQTVETVAAADGQAITPPAPAAGDTRPIAGLSTGGSTRSREYFRTVARLGIQAAEALDHAHQLGVVHRDVKPANLLVDADGHLWVTDFGLAQMQSETRLTLTGDLVGTLRYMSPEQALAKRVVADHRTDIYSLGATLYELLTLEPAFGGRDRQELLRQIAFDEPRRLRRWNQSIPQELETIVLKAMERNPADRYPTALDLADDLRRFLEDKPIRAKRPTLRQRANKWVRRHQTIVRAAAVMLLLAVVGLAASAVLIWQAKKDTDDALAKAEDQRKSADKERQIAQEQRNTADTQREIAERRLHVARLHLAREAWERADITRMEDLLQSLLPQPGQPDLRGWEWHYLKALCHRDLLTLTFRGPGGAVAWSPDGKRFALAAGANTIEVREAATGQEVASLRGHARGVTAVAWSPDGRRLASGSSGDGLIVIWDTATGQELVTLQQFTRVTSSKQSHLLAWSPDSQRLAAASGDGKTVIVWNAGTGQEMFTLRGHRDYIVSVTWSPDGRWLASTGIDGTFKVWDPANRQESFALPSVPAFQPLEQLASWSPDGKRLAVVTAAQTVKVCEAATGKELVSLRGHEGGVTSLSWGPEGRLASAGEDGTVVIWDTATGQRTRTLGGHTEAVWSVAWSPEGGRIASAGRDRTVRVWDPRNGEEILTLRGHTREAFAVFWTPDGLGLISVGADHTVRIWDATVAQDALPLWAHRSWVRSVAWSPDGRYLASSGDGQDLTVKVWDTATGKETLTLRGHTEFAWSVAWSPDGRKLASVSHDRTVKVWDVPTGKEILTRPTWGGSGPLAWSPDGRRLASVGRDAKTIEVWDADTGQEILALRGPTSVSEVAWSPAGNLLASTSGDGIKVWDTSTGQEAITLREHKSVRALAWRPDGRRLASVGLSGYTVKVWDVVTGQEALTLKGHIRVLDTVHGGSHPMVASVAWSPDGKRLASAVGEGPVKVWDADTGLELLELRGHREWYSSVAWSPDGQRLASGSLQGVIRIWDSSKRGPWEPSLAWYNNALAWSLATCPDPQFRSPARAVELARRAVQLAPEVGTGGCWNTLGVAHYRTGDWKATLAALEKAMQLSNGGDGTDWFFLAMAHWQLGGKDEARTWYDKAVQWMDRNNPKDPELRCFRAEAAELLGIEQKKD